MTGPGSLRDWKALSADYASYHTTRGNQLCHAVGIPLIVLAIADWTRWPAGNPVPLAAALLPVYLVWDLRLALGMLALVTACAGVAPLLPPGGALAAFVVGWIFQLVGHKLYEGKSPAFMRNLIHLLVGPAWLLQKLLPAASR